MAAYLCLWWGRVERMVDMVGDVGREAPVVAAVLEQVLPRHRGVGEPADNLCRLFAFFRSYIIIF